MFQILAHLPYIFFQYPKWIEDNKDNKDVAADMNNYKRQHELISVIIGEFEAEKETDTDEEKGQRFEKVMDLMQQVEYIEDIHFFEVNTKYISSSVLKTSEFSLVKI